MLHPQGFYPQGLNPFYPQGLTLRVSIPRAVSTILKPASIPLADSIHRAARAFHAGLLREHTVRSSPARTRSGLAAGELATRPRSRRFSSCLPNNWRRSLALPTRAVQLAGCPMARVRKRPAHGRSTIIWGRSIPRCSSSGRSNRILQQLAQHHYAIAQQLLQLAAQQTLQGTASPYAGQFIPGQRPSFRPRWEAASFRASPCIEASASIDDEMIVTGSR